jgi:hypothetical protein
MKKIIFLLIVLCSLTSHDVAAQHSGIYIYTGDAFVSTCFDLDKLNLSGTYRVNTVLLSAGLGFRTDTGTSFEIGALLNDSYLKDDKQYSEVISALCARITHSTQFYGNVNWMFAFSYRYLSVSQNGNSGRFNDLLIEPLVFEYLTNNKHWGFQLSLLSLEGMVPISEKHKNDPVGYKTNSENIAIGAGFNSFPIRIAYYF